MAKVEIEEHEFLNNQKLQNTVKKMLENKDSRELVQKAYKIVDPNASVPEIDTKVATENAAAAAQKVVDDFRKEQTELRAKEAADRNMADLTGRWNKGRAALKSQKYTEEGIAAVEKLMEERGIADHGDAQIIFERLHPPSAVADPSPGAWGFMDKNGTDSSAEDMKRLFESRGEDEGILRKMVNQTLKEVRGN